MCSELKYFIIYFKKLFDRIRIGFYLKKVNSFNNLCTHLMRMSIVDDFEGRKDKNTIGKYYYWIYS